MLGLERFLQSNDYPASEIILTATYLLIRPASFTCWLLLACPFPLLSIFLHFPIDFSYLQTSLKNQALMGLFTHYSRFYRIPFPKMPSVCNPFVAVKFFRLCAFDCVRGVICQSLLLPALICCLRGVIGAKLAALFLPLFMEQAYIRVELRRALPSKEMEHSHRLLRGWLLHVDLEVDAFYRFQLKEKVPSRRKAF